MFTKMLNAKSSMTAAKAVAKFAGAVLAADFASGVIHWAEDAYGSEDLPIIGPWILKPNIEHHFKPRNFVHKSWFQSSWDLSLGAAALVAGTWKLGKLRWPMVVFAAIAANANEIHKWSHRTPRENGRVITALQRLRLVQTVRHHARHHTDPKDTHYCAVTNLLNPALQWFHLWEGSEWLLLHTLGLRRRVDASVKVRHTASSLAIA